MVAWPLLAIIGLYLYSRWRKPLGKVLLVVLALIVVATLGPRLPCGRLHALRVTMETD